MRYRLIYISAFLLVFVASCGPKHLGPRAPVPLGTDVSAGTPEHRNAGSGLPFPRLHFPTGSDRVIGHERLRLIQNAKWLLDNKEVVVVLEGHCDERGSNRFNIQLGDRRARNVKAALIRQGVPDEQVPAIISHGERKPLDRRHTPAAWRKNRRVEFVLR